MRVIARKKLDKPIMLGAGDQLIMSYVEIDGVVRNYKVSQFAVVKPYRAVTVDEALLVEAEFEGRYIVGGMLVEAKADDRRNEIPKSGEAPRAARGKVFSGTSAAQEAARRREREGRND